MNTVLTFLKSHGERLDLGRYGTPDRLSCVILTPRFRASAHVVFLMLADGRPIRVAPYESEVVSELIA